MSTLRYSGEIRIRVTYLDWRPGELFIDGTPRNPNGRYRCFLKGPGGMRTTIVVCAPAFLSVGVDDPEAFDDAARAAIAFADNTPDDVDGPAWNDVSAFKIDGSGWHIGRTIAEAWPKVEPRSGGDFVNDRGE